MGKHSTYRKRGTASPHAPAVPAPNPPIITFVLGDILQTTTSGADLFGSIRLYYSVLDSGPFGFLSEQEWQSDYAWSDAVTIVSGYYYATELGNGTDYDGESAPSNVVTVP